VKTILAIAIYILLKDLPFDAILGIVAGASFALLCAMVFVGPTPAKRTVRKSTRRKRAAYVFTPVNYEWSAA